MLTERRKKKKKVLYDKEVKDQAKFTLLLVQKAKAETLNFPFENFPLESCVQFCLAFCPVKPLLSCVL